MAKIDRSLAIFIGINEYSHIPKLKNAVSDAQELGLVLEEKYGYKVLPLLDEEASKEKLDELLANLDKRIIPFKDEEFQVEQSDRLLFYFAGHGFSEEAVEDEEGIVKPSGYLIPRNAQWDNPKTWISMQTLHDVLTALDCRHLLIILDCCFAGSIRWAELHRNAVRPRKIYRESYSRFTDGKARQVITSAAYDQKALDAYRFGQRGKGKENGHSPFAHLLLKVLQGNSDGGKDKFIEAIAEDKVITAHEMIAYLKNKLLEEQTPELFEIKGHDKGEYIFLLPDFNEEKDLDSLPLTEAQNPYLGLNAYEKKDSHLFFGRRKLSEELREFVLTHPLIVVLGASGSGKSSLVKAGLIPALEESEEDKQDTQEIWCIPTPIRPGESPVDKLKQVIDLKAPETFESKQHELAMRITILSQIPTGSKCLLVIDQSEELFTQCQDEKQRQQFLNLLAKALETYSDRLHIVLTLRSDYEPQFRDTALKDRWQEALFPVKPMSREEYEEVIEEPAASRALFFESPQFVNKLIDEVILMPGALPLLSFTLSELYRLYLDEQQEIGRDDRTITEKDYKNTLGTVTNALSGRAEQICQELVKTLVTLGILIFRSRLLPKFSILLLILEKEKAAYERSIRNVMLRMIAVGGKGLARRQVLLSELKYPEPENSRIKNVIKIFVEARLLVSDIYNKSTEEMQELEEDKLYVEPAHDELLRGWPRIERWLKERQPDVKGVSWWQRFQNWFSQGLEIINPFLSKETEKLEAQKPLKVNLVLQRAVTNAANNYQESLDKGKKRKAIGYLWNGDPRLPQLKKIADSDDNWLNDREQRFIDGSIQREIRNRSLLATGITIFVLGLSIAGGIAEWRRRIAVDQTAIAQKRQAGQVEALGSYSETLFLNNQKFEALIGNIRAGVGLKGVKEADEPEAKVTNEMVILVMLHQLLDGFIESNRLEGHKDIVSSVRFSSKNDLIASADWDGTIKLWNLDGTLKITIKKHNNTVNSIRFSPDGKLIASASDDGTVKLWKLDGTIVKTLTEHNGSVLSVSFSPKGDIIATVGEDGTIKLWKLDGTPINTLTGHTKEIRGISFSPDGKRIASASLDGTIKLWKLDGTLENTMEEHEDQVWAVSFSPNGELMASASGDGTIKLWKPDGTLLRTLTGHGAWVLDVTFSSDGQTIASASEDQTVKLWKYSKPLQTLLTGHDSDSLVSNVSFDPKNELIASASWDGTAKLWKRDGTFDCTLQGHSDSVESVSFSPSDGKLIASASHDKTIKLWNRDCELQQTLSDHEEPVFDVSFSPDGQMLASASEDKTIKLWKRDASFMNPDTFKGHTETINSVRFSPDGKMLASASWDNTIKLWNIPNLDGSSFATLNHEGMILDVSFSSDGTMLASAGGDNIINLWELDGNQQPTLRLQIFAGCTSEFPRPRGEVLSVEFSQDSQLMAATCGDNTVKIWKRDGTPLTELTAGSEAEFWGVSFSPDGNTLASGSGDGTVVGWNLNLDDLLRRGCNLVRDHLDRNPNVNESDSTLCDDISSPEEKSGLTR